MRRLMHTETQTDVTDTKYVWDKYTQMKYANHVQK